VQLSRTAAIDVGVLVLGVLAFSAGAEAKCRLADFALSPDGRTIAFACPSAIGLFERRTGQIRAIAPTGGIKGMGFLSYSSDGGKLAASITMELGKPPMLGVVDIASGTVSLLPAEATGVYPVFQPDDKAILYRPSAYPEHLSLFDISTRTTRDVIPRRPGFYTIFKPSFLDSHTILFAGMGPNDPHTAALVRELGASDASSIPYRLRLGSTIEVAYPDIVRRHVALRGEPPTNYSASRDGRRVVFIGRSQSEEERHSHEVGGHFRYDLFVIEDGSVRQVTNLKSYISSQTISADGSTAAIGIYAKPVSEFRYEKAQDRPFDLWIVDLGTGAVTPTDLLSRINRDGRFSERQ
jgi:Tol biopolymer transport system component